MNEYLPYIFLSLAAVYILALARFDRNKFKGTHCIAGMLTGFLVGMMLGAALKQVELISSIGMLAGAAAGTFFSKKKPLK